MDVYLMQHGVAEAADANPQRPLTAGGRRTVEAVARQAASCGVSIDRIVHSPKLRARQSAQILGASLGCSDLVEVSGLAPKDSVEAAAAALVDTGRPGSVAIVGHLPFLERFASLLVVGDAAARVVAFENGGLVRLVPAGLPSPRGPVGGFAVSWILSPALLVG